MILFGFSRDLFSGVTVFPLLHSWAQWVFWHHCITIASTVASSRLGYRKIFNDLTETCYLLMVTKSQWFFPIWILIVLVKYMHMRNLQQQVKKAFCYQKLFCPFTVWINCFSDLNHFENSWPAASKFKRFSRKLEHFFVTVGQNNFGNRIPFSKKLQCAVDWCVELHHWLI